jgi:hypothetical protein
VNFQPNARYIAEESTLHYNSCENPESCIILSELIISLTPAVVFIAHSEVTGFESWPDTRYFD